MEPENSSDQPNPNCISFREAFIFWIKLGFINFGGPAGQIAILYKEVVERKNWIDEALFQKALGYCMLLPGPEAQQITTYVGWRLHGVLGGVVAGSFFIIPSIFVLLFFSWMSVAWSHMPAVAGFLYGIQPVVVAIVIEAVLKISKRTLNHAALVIFAVGAFIALQVIHVPFPLVILLAAFGGYLAQYRWPTVFHPPQKPTISHPANSSSCGINDAGCQPFFPDCLVWLVSSLFSGQYLSVRFGFGRERQSFCGRKPCFFRKSRMLLSAEPMQFLPTLPKRLSISISG